MESSTEFLPISFDRPASVDEALAADKLERRGFAEEVAQLLRNVGPNASFALSIEGPWGSGKTQVLHMIEALLRDEPQSTRPVLVHFNPWLVGDKDALLRQFFAQMAAALELTKHVSNAKSAAKQLISYSKVFDVVKWVPGAEPWASILKGVLEATGTGVQAAAEQKSPGLEEQKAGVERALRKFGRRIIVFIDDVDRLYPQEVFEMIRIVKSVGDLPNIGYVVALDHAYVCEALRHASVPFPENYLDKVIQQRVVMPTLSSSGRQRLIDAQWKQIDAAAFEPRFRNSDQRYAKMYGYGAFELLEHPRDVARAFNVLRVLEKRVRGNVVLADLIAFSILQVKAAPVCSLVRSNRRWFVGKSVGDLTDIAADTDDEKRAAIESALAACALPWLVRRVLNFLFPVALHAGGAKLVKAAEGHIGDPGRLEIVLKQGADNHDIDYVLVRSYVFDPQKRKEIETGVPVFLAYEFVNTIADFVDETMQVELSGMLPGLCLSLAAYADSAEFASRSRDRLFLQPFGPRVTLVAIERIARKMGSEQRASIAKRIAMNADSISLGAFLVDASYRDKDSSDILCCQPEDQDIVVDGFCSNVMDAARDERLSKLSGLGYVLHVMNEFAPQRCKELFSIIRAAPAQLDAFIMALADHGMDSVNGQRYALVRSLKVVESFCSLEELSAIARNRLEDKSLVYPGRAAWQAALYDKIYYGADGTEAAR